MKLLLFGIAVILFGALMEFSFSPAGVGTIIAFIGLIVSAIGAFKTEKK